MRFLFREKTDLGKVPFFRPRKMELFVGLAMAFLVGAAALRQAPREELMAVSERGCTYPGRCGSMECNSYCTLLKP